MDRPETGHSGAVQRLGEQLDADEGEYHAQAGLQVDQSGEQPGHQEVQVAQPEQGEHVRAEHQERIPGQPEHGRDGVDREDEVSHPERDHQREHPGRAAPGQPCRDAPRGPARRVLCRGAWHPGFVRGGPAGPRELAGDVTGAGSGGLRCLVRVPRYLGRRIEEKEAEQVFQPPEPVQGGRAEPDDGAAQHHGDTDAGEHHAAVEPARHLGPADQDDEDQQVVHGEAVLGQPAGEELPGGRAPRGDGQHGAEAHRQHHGGQRPPGRFCHADRTVPAGTRQQIRAEQHDKGGDKRRPAPHRDLKRCHGYPMALTGLSSWPSPACVVAYRSGAPVAGGTLCQPGPGTIKVPGSGRGRAGRDEQCPGLLPNAAGDLSGAGAAPGAP